LGTTKSARPLTAARAIILHLLRDESGQDLIEYALLGALISLSAVISIKGLANKIENTFNDVGNQLTNAV
jgi:pilus assembly protein Flp/PilA